MNCESYWSHQKVHAVVSAWRLSRVCSHPHTTQQLHGATECQSNPVKIILDAFYYKLWTIGKLVDRVSLLATEILRLICWNTGKLIQLIFYINNYWLNTTKRGKHTNKCTKILVAAVVLILFWSFTNSS